MRAFIISQFIYWLLVWMCQTRTVSNKINKLHERALRLVYNDRQSMFGHRNLQVLATEMYKVYSSVAPDIMNNISEKKENINLGTINIFFEEILNLYIMDQKQYI